jgi:hypothetical protein
VNHAPASSRRAALLLLLLSSVAACTTGHGIDVTRSTSLFQPAKGTPYLVLLSSDQGDDPSYQNYAQTLSVQLQAQGLTTVREAARAHYAIMLERDWPHHGRTTPADQSDAVSAHTHGMGGGMGHGGEHHHGGGTSASQEDPRATSLLIGIFDLTKPNRPDERVFFAKAHAATGKDDNDAVVDAMIVAALRDFPGKARESYDVALPR